MECILLRKKKNTLLRDAIDASSAAPTFFPPVKIGNDWFIDGCFVQNDPSMCALAEAIEIFGSEHPIRILSIGTGDIDRPIPGEVAFENRWGAFQWLKDGSLMELLLNDTIASVTAKNILGENYLRVNDLLNTYNVSVEIDCQSPENLENLKTMGNDLYDKFRVQILSLLYSMDISRTDLFCSQFDT